MRRIRRSGLVWYAFEDSGDGLGHALLTRQGGVSEAPFATLNLGHTVGDAPAAVAENHQRVLNAFGLTAVQVVSPYQVHGCHVARVGLAEGGTVIPETDALVTNTQGVALLMRFADCTPVLFYDAPHKAIGLAHAGWRGAAAGVVVATIRAMREMFDTLPQDLWVGIGPSIGLDHYAVGPEVIEAIRKTLPPDSREVVNRQGDQWYLDLPHVVEVQAQSAGVTHIERSNICTACHLDEWYSHRAEHGATGRFGVLMWLE